MSSFTRLSRTLTLVLLTAVSLGAHAAIDINKASADQLQSIKGIGPQLSMRIMEARQKATFKSWGDLIDRIDGLGSAKAARLSAQGLTVAGAAFAATDSMVTAVAPPRQASSGPATPATTSTRSAMPAPSVKTPVAPPASPSVKATTTVPTAPSAVSKTVGPSGALTAPRMGGTPGGQPVTPARTGGPTMAPR